MKKSQISVRNPVAKNGPKFNKSVRFADQKLLVKHGYEKHKNRNEEHSHG